MFSSSPSRVLCPRGSAPCGRCTSLPVTSCPGWDVACARVLFMRDIRGLVRATVEAALCLRVQREAIETLIAARPPSCVFIYNASGSWVWWWWWWWWECRMLRQAPAALCLLVRMRFLSSLSLVSALRVSPFFLGSAGSSCLLSEFFSLKKKLWSFLVREQRRKLMLTLPAYYLQTFDSALTKPFFSFIKQEFTALKTQ